LYSPGRRPRPRVISPVLSQPDLTPGKGCPRALRPEISGFDCRTSEPGDLGGSISLDDGYTDPGKTGRCPGLKLPRPKWVYGLFVSPICPAGDGIPPNNPCNSTPARTDSVSFALLGLSDFITDGQERLVKEFLPERGIDHLGLDFRARPSPIGEPQRITRGAISRRSERTVSAFRQIDHHAHDQIGSHRKNLFSNPGWGRQERFSSSSSRAGRIHPGISRAGCGR